MTTPAAEPPPQQSPPTQATVIGAFAAAAALALTAPRPPIFWLAQLDTVLLPLLGTVWSAAFNPTEGTDVGSADETYLRHVREHLTGIDLTQPRRAAVTEFKAARHAGRLAGMQAKLPPGSTKRWKTQRDNRVRDSHRALEGVTIPVADSFDVGGSPAPAPGWWTLPPGERAACRCRLTYATPSMTAAGGPVTDGPIAAGLAVVARDTGRVLMLQRHLPVDGDTSDPAAGTWEFPGGTLDPGETAIEAAKREFTEETGLDAPTDMMDNWTSDNGVYELFIATVDHEADLDITQRADGLNPDDPDGDMTEALAWWSPQDAANNPALRPEAQNTPWSLLDCGCDGGASDVMDELSPAEADALMSKLGLTAAAGGPDRNRGNAETLRRYWVDGPGAAKIDWGVPGDFDRCVTLLTPHLGVRAKGYCQLRHHDATGAWAGHAPGEKFAMHASLEDDEMTDARVLAALAELQEGIAALTAAADKVSDAPWSPSTADYSHEQWRHACIVHLPGGNTYDHHKLPVREPDGTLNRNGVHAAAGRIHAVQAPPDALHAAARKLAALYRGPLNEDPPPSLLSMTAASTAEDLVAAGSAYPGEPVYDIALFKNPNLTAATPLTIDGSHVYGHVADFSVCHRSFKKCRTAPRSRTGYSQFHVGEVMTSAGPLAVGNLVLATDHAALTMTADAASQHYANSGSAVAVVRAGEDKFGVWVSGSIIEGTDPHMVATLRRCPLSGDWRNSEMVAALAVNVPGLPIAREHVSGGQQLAMVAAGALPNPYMERFDQIASDLQQERFTNLYADLLAERVLQ